MCTNEALGAALGLSASSASRMRSGKRGGSITVLRRIAQVNNETLDDVLTASERAREGDLEKWQSLLDRVCAEAAPETEPAPQ